MQQVGTHNQTHELNQRKIRQKEPGKEGGRVQSKRTKKGKGKGEKKKSVSGVPESTNGGAGKRRDKENWGEGEKVSEKEVGWGGGKEERVGARERRKVGQKRPLRDPARQRRH